MNDSDNETAVVRVDFGAELKKGRKSQNYAIEDVSEHLKIPVQTLRALEAGDIESLPAQTFTQGYIRSYARYLEIAEDELIDSYNSHFPDVQAEKLKVRPTVAEGASSKSPIVMAVTGLLIIAGVAAVIFGSISYYQEKADVLETEREPVDLEDIGSSLDSPSQYGYTQDGSNRLEIRQNARPDEDDGLVLTQEADDQDLSPAAEDVAVVDSESEVISQDVLKIHAEQGSWIEVRDANNERLLYNMIPSRGDRTIIGQAPFSITMGNARTAHIVVNDLEVDLSDYIRSNNTASFSVSTEGQNIIFH